MPHNAVPLFTRGHVLPMTFFCFLLSVTVLSAPRGLYCVTIHTGSASVVSNVPLWSVSLPLPEVAGSGNYSNGVRPELSEVSDPATPPRGHCRSNYKNLSASIHLLCQVGFSPLTHVKEMCHRLTALSHNGLFSLEQDVWTPFFLDL